MYSPETSKSITQKEFGLILINRFELQENENRAKDQLPEMDKVIKDDAPAHPLMIVRSKDLKDVVIDRLDIFRSCFVNCNIPKTIKNTGFLCSLFKDCLFENCVFVNVDFSCSVFSRSELVRCKFINCDLSSEFNKCTIHECNFDSCEFYETTLRKSTMARNQFANSKLHMFKGVATTKNGNKENNIYDNTFDNCTPLSEKKRVIEMLLDISEKEKLYYKDLKNKPTHTHIRGEHVKRRTKPINKDTKPTVKKRKSLIMDKNGDFDELRFF